MLRKCFVHRQTERITAKHALKLITVLGGQQTPQQRRQAPPRPPMRPPARAREELERQVAGAEAQMAERATVEEAATMEERAASDICSLLRAAMLEQITLPPGWTGPYPATGEMAGHYFYVDPQGQSHWDVALAHKSN